MKIDFTKLFATICFVGVLVVNYLANALPINNTTTGDISNSYPNLFAPASITFSIWGVIYLLLGLYVLYQFSVFGDVKKNSLLKRVNAYFIITSVANMLWIFAWHFDYIGISIIFMLLLLFSLIKISIILFNKSKHLTSKEYFFIKLPFSVYFGWITIATIANITTFLVKINWNGFGLTNQLWTVIVLIAGLLIGAITGFSKQDIAYIAVLIWAYAGILLKHITEFNSEYTGVLLVTLLSIAIYIVLIGLVLKKNIRESTTSTPEK
ncbi:MAG: tryptophan-rich sensory protein [Nanobdellota archaeon]